MKKNLSYFICIFIVSTCFLIFSSSISFAQQKKIHYQGELNVGMSMGGKVIDGKFQLNGSSIRLNTVHGIRYNDYWFFGLGTGLNLINYDPLKPSDRTSWGNFGFPLYIDVKAYLPIGKNRIVSFMGVFDAGASHYLNVQGTSEVSHFQLFIHPQVGFDFKTGEKCSLYITLGYRYEYVSQLSASIGFTF